MEETASTGELAMMVGMALTPMRWLGQVGGGGGGEGTAQAQWRGCRGGWQALMARRRGKGALGGGCAGEGWARGMKLTSGPWLLTRGNDVRGRGMRR
jgi:hypothetical protein